MKSGKILAALLAIAMVVSGCSGKSNKEYTVTSEIVTDSLQDDSKSEIEEDTQASLDATGADKTDKVEEADIVEEADVADKEDKTEADETEADIVDILGTNDGKVYENKFIGIGYKLNDGYTLYTDEQIKELNNMTSDMAGNEYRELMSNATIIYDMFAADSSGLNSINLNLEKLDDQQIAFLNVKQNFEAAVDIMEDTYNNLGCTNFKYDISTVEIDGREVDALYIEAEINGTSLYQTLFGVKCDGYLANIAVSTYFTNTTSDIINNIYWLD